MGSKGFALAQYGTTEVEKGSIFKFSSVKKSEALKSIMNVTVETFL